MHCYCCFCWPTKAFQADQANLRTSGLNIQSCFHSHSQSLSLHFVSFSSLSFAFQAGHLAAPDSIINCALHSIYLSCFFSGKTSVCVCETLICYTWRMRVFNLKTKSTTRTGTSTPNSFTSVTPFETVRFFILHTPWIQMIRGSLLAPIQTHFLCHSKWQCELDSCYVSALLNISNDSKCRIM